MRRKIVAGNWKMNKTPSEAKVLAAEIKSALGNEQCPVEVVVCPPFVDIPAVTEILAGSQIGIGAQNMHFEAKGAFTGECSAAMLQDLGLGYVIIGHSERRAYFAETDATVNAKVKAALAAGFTPIVCVGESLEERESDKTAAVITAQVKTGLAGIGDDLARVVVAYEPIWAIGTGKTATAEQANEVCGLIRNVIAGLYNDAAAKAVTIQYGGSMNAGNAAQLLAMSDVDGGLIGGASLKPNDFATIVAAAK